MTRKDYSAAGAKPKQPVDSPIEDIIKRMGTLITGNKLPPQLARDLEKLCIYARRGIAAGEGQ